MKAWIVSVVVLALVGGCAMKREPIVAIPLPCIHPITLDKFHGCKTIPNTTNKATCLVDITYDCIAPVKEKGKDDDEQKAVPRWHDGSDDSSNLAQKVVPIDHP